MSGVIRQPYYTVKEVADMYGVAVTTVYYWIKQGLEYETAYVLGKGRIKIIHKQSLAEYFNKGATFDMNSDKYI